MTMPIDAAPAQTVPVPPAVQAAPTALASKKGDFTFHDLLETINPLQHLPLISTAYRAITGDSISPAARIAGDGLYGGIFGLAGSIVDSLVEGETGKDIGTHIVDTVFGDDDDKVPTPSPATAAASAASDSPGAPISLLPPTSGASAAATASVSALSAATAAATAQANAPQRPLPPTDFFMSEQKAAHGGRGVPLSTTVPVGDDHKDAKAALEKKINDALANAAKAAGNPAAAPTSATNPAAAPATATPPTPLLPSAPAASAAGVPTASATPPAAASGNIAALMMQALDKYKTLDQQRASNTPTPPPVLIN